MVKNPFMKAKILLILSILLVMKVANAQIMFEKTFGGSADDWLTSVKKTTDGGYILAGTTMSYGAGDADVYLIKLDETGDTLWTKTFGGSGYDEAYCVLQTADSGYIIAGGTNSFGAGLMDVYLIRTTSNGDTIWTKTYGGINDDHGIEVIENLDGSFIISGTTLSFTNGFSAIYVIKTESNGNMIWQKQYEKLWSNHAARMIHSSIDDFVIVGSTKELSADFAIYILKLNINGDTLWTRSYSDPTGDVFGISVNLTLDNCLIIAGNLIQTGGIGKVLIMKSDISGNNIWNNYYGSNAGVIAGGDVIATSDGGYAFSGLIADISKNEMNAIGKNNHFPINYLMREMWINGDACLLKLNSDGDSLWSKSYGGSNDDAGGCIIQTGDNGYLLAGWSKKSSNNKDVYIIKTDATGYCGSNTSAAFLNSDFKVFPNPSDGLFNIHSSVLSGESFDIEVFEIAGQKIYNNNFSDTHVTIDFSSYHKGVYLIKIKYIKGDFTSKFVIY